MRGGRKGSAGSITSCCSPGAVWKGNLGLMLWAHVRAAVMPMLAAFWNTLSTASFWLAVTRTKHQADSKDRQLVNPASIQKHHQVCSDTVMGALAENVNQNQPQWPRQSYCVTAPLFTAALTCCHGGELKGLQGQTVDNMCMSVGLFAAHQCICQPCA